MKSNNKKMIFLLIIAAIMLFTILSGCEKNIADNEHVIDGIKINIKIPSEKSWDKWVNDESGQIIALRESFIENFLKEYTNLGKNIDILDGEKKEYIVGYILIEFDNNKLSGALELYDYLNNNSEQISIEYDNENDSDESLEEKSLNEHGKNEHGLNNGELTYIAYAPIKTGWQIKYEELLLVDKQKGIIFLLEDFTNLTEDQIDNMLTEEQLEKAARYMLEYFQMDMNIDVGRLLDLLNYSESTYNENSNDNETTKEENADIREIETVSLIKSIERLEIKENEILLSVIFKEDISHVELYLVNDKTNKELIEKSDKKYGTGETIELLFTGLKNQCEYIIEFSGQSQTQKIEFATFKDSDEMQLSYHVSLLSADGQITRVFINGVIGSKTRFILRGTAGHVFPYGAVGLIPGSEKLNGESATVEDYDSNAIEISGKTGDYFCLSYDAKKDDSIPEGQVTIPGYLDNTVFYAGGEMIFLYPDIELAYDVYTSAVLPLDWESSFFGSKKNTDITYSNCPDSWDTGRQFYAYNVNAYSVYNEKIDDMDISVIYYLRHEKYIQPLMDILITVSDLWGSGNPDVSEYKVMLIADVIGKDGSIIPSYAGEHDDGQAVSCNYGLPISILSHQFYHVYNGFSKGIEVEDHQESGMWNEGFNVFYNICHETLFEKGNHQYVIDNYNQYINTYTSANDYYIFDNNIDPYSNGFVYAYAIDKELRRLTDDNKSLDDVLKYFWADWLEYQNPYTNERMLAYLNSVTDDKFNAWWDAYIIDGKQINVDELLEDNSYFEERVKIYK